MIQFGFLSMRTVLIVSDGDMTPELERTILWRSDIERVFEDAPGAVETAARVRPDLVIIDGGDLRVATAVLRDLRRSPDSQGAALAVVTSTTYSTADEDALRRAGANVVLTGPVDESLWDWRLEGLLALPRRREFRVPVTFTVWSESGASSPPTAAVGLNVSLRGLLLESIQPQDVGVTLDLTIQVPQGGPIEGVGRVVWVTSGGGRCHAGVEFVNLPGDGRERLRRFMEVEVE
jgi:CheY-like chemotaxis protein